MVATDHSRSGADQRRAPRRQFHYSAHILVDDKGTVHKCSIADISPAGARLVLENECALPDRFVLLLSETGSARRHCRLVWRSEMTVGVAFADQET